MEPENGKEKREKKGTASQPASLAGQKASTSTPILHLNLKEAKVGRGQVPKTIWAHRHPTLILPGALVGKVHW